MLTIHKKMVIDDQGRPTEVIIPWEEYQELAELLGLDLDEDAIEDLSRAKADRDSGNQDAYASLDSI